MKTIRSVAAALLAASLFLPSLASSSTQGQDPEKSCERILSSVRFMELEGALQWALELSGGMTSLLGNPLQLPHSLTPVDMTHPGRVLMQSPLGLSRWQVVELNDWLYFSIFFSQQPTEAVAAALFRVGMSEDKDFFPDAGPHMPRLENSNLFHQAYERIRIDYSLAQMSWDDFHNFLKLEKGRGADSELFTGFFGAPAPLNNRTDITREDYQEALKHANLLLREGYQNSKGFGLFHPGLLTIMNDTDLPFFPSGSQTLMASRALLRSALIERLLPTPSDTQTLSQTLTFDEILTIAYFPELLPFHRFMNELTLNFQDIDSPFLPAHGLPQLATHDSYTIIDGVKACLDLVRGLTAANIETLSASLQFTTLYFSEGNDDEGLLTLETQRLTEVVNSYWKIYVTSTGYTDVAFPNIFYSEENHAMVIRDLDPIHAVGFYLFLRLVDPPAESTNDSQEK